VFAISGKTTDIRSMIGRFISSGSRCLPGKYHRQSLVIATDGNGLTQTKKELKWYFIGWRYLKSRSDFYDTSAISVNI